MCVVKMQLLLITNGSSITAERKRKVRYYFKGNFGQIINLEKDFRGYIDVKLVVISESHGLVRGGEMIGSESGEKNYQPDKISSKLSNMISNYQLGFISLPKWIFLDIFKPSEEKDLTKRFSPDSIWGLFVSQTVLDLLNYKMIKEKNIVLITEPRKGVARYTNTIKKEFLRKIRETIDLRN
ncbi:hypothetical protein AKJ38_03340 [candidate division MSBL1 archaeon SCGC-AAA259I14]|uniref:Uncharacterized protein n=1 Tax=candidate division MSBL1 archaeon SCGC-AAA259I14 TaxID=1698268 RepID=A0A133UQI1_9EURY|nr:hypothetical protein AKJ38_03340 [candidate division MSBL1 archaeon SCGC-AAA259I14]